MSRERRVVDAAPGARPSLAEKPKRSRPKSMRLWMTDHFVVANGSGESELGGCVVNANYSETYGFRFEVKTRRFSGWEDDVLVGDLSTDDLTVLASWIISELCRRRKHLEGRMSQLEPSTAPNQRTLQAGAASNKESE